MRKVLASSVVVLMVLFLSAGLGLTRGPGGGSGVGGGGGSKGSQAGLSSIIANLPYQDLSDVEEAGLIHMREEEKLARDIYEILYNKWGLIIFSNIAQAEQRHMTAIKSLLDKYYVPDPITDLTVGVFPTPEVQALYNALVEKGNKSLVDALHVGATIEDLDIKDLYDYLIETDNSDIKTVYQNLVKGSRNHLRAFVFQLSLNGATYEAQYLTQDEIDDILTSPRERGRVDEDGNPVTGGNMGGGQGGRR